MDTNINFFLVGVLNLKDSDVVTDCHVRRVGDSEGIRSAKPDTYRAANNILPMALDGKIVISLYWTDKHLVTEDKTDQLK